ncbi:ABC transporter permease [Ilumatobacter sp.]|uniref:ABC transporter permease n=1 Tax=Ilumatobacter sp. TaxID=1967498 RepID=UPI003AF4A998
MSDAQILDRGYRRFEGDRSGVGGAMRSVAWHTVRSILGLGRKARHKVFPIIVLVVAFVPAIAFLAITVLLGDLGDELRPEYWEFFGFSFVATIVFVALVAPEAIVRDQRDGMFAMYLSTPLSRWSYVVSKVIAVLGTMSLVVLGPPVLWVLGYTFQSQGPDGLVDWFGVVGRLLLAGLIVCIVYTAVSLGVSSLTDRRAFASIAVVFVMLGASIVTNVLVDVAELAENWRVLDPLGVALEVAPRLFGDRSEEFTTVSTWLVAAGCAGWTAFGAGLLVYRYRRLAAV